MTEQAILQALQSSGLLIRNGHAKKGDSLPLVVVQISHPDNTPADNMTYLKNPTGRAELYTLGKDYISMAKLENALQNAKIPWAHDTSFDDSEKVFIEVYTFAQVGGSVEPVPEG